MNYAKLLEINSFFTWHIFLKIGKTQDMPSKIWQTLGDALRPAVKFSVKAGKLGRLKMGFSRFGSLHLHSRNIFS